jgi:hypothetical protein
MDLSVAANEWRTEGFVILPGFLAAAELDEALRALPDMFPTASEYHDGVDERRNARFRGDEFAGLVTFPFACHPLSLLAVHPKIVGFAEAVFDTPDIRIYNAEAW